MYRYYGISLWRRCLFYLLPVEIETLFLKSYQVISHLALDIKIENILIRTTTSFTKGGTQFSFTANFISIIMKNYLSTT
jgi:hypothetical protein